MPKQPAFPGLCNAMKNKVTRREQFLAEMNAEFPWGRLLALIEPHYPEAGTKGGRPPRPPGCRHLGALERVDETVLKRRPAAINADRGARHLIGGGGAEIDGSAADLFDRGKLP